MGSNIQRHKVYMGKAERKRDRHGGLQESRRCRGYLEGDGHASDGNESIEAVVVAADGSGRAGSAASDADDGDGATRQADVDIQALDDDAKERDERRGSGVGRRNDTLAARKATRITFADGRRARSNRRDRC